jgi:hypothetical protein
LSSHLRTSVVSRCGNGETTGSAVLWQRRAQLYFFMTRPQLDKPSSSVHCSSSGASMRPASSGCLVNIYLSPE